MLFAVLEWTSYINVDLESILTQGLEDKVIESIDNIEWPTKLPIFWLLKGLKSSRN